MVRVSACHAEGREFESRLSRHLIVDQWCNGSTEVFGTSSRGSSPCWSATYKKSLTIAKLSAILLIMDEIKKELQKLTKQISISNGYTDDVRIELNKINETLMLIAQILRNK